MNTTIANAIQLHQAEFTTYLTDAIIGIGFMILILIVANLIAWQPGAHDNSPAKRRLWFWILGACTLFTCLGVDYMVWMRHIKRAQFISEYTMHMVLAAIVGVVVYGLVTFLICKLQKKDTKLASMFK